MVGAYAQPVQTVQRLMLVKLNAHYTNEPLSMHSAINQHLNNCADYHHFRGLHAINGTLDLKEFYMNTVRNNVCISAKTRNWQTLLFLEALYIKDQSPQLNTGLKATKQLQLF